MADIRAKLFSACRKGEFETVKKLLVQGAPLNFMIKGFTPLYAACESGSTDCVRLLLQHQTNYPINRNCNGYTPLHCAAYKGFTGIVKCLVEHQADIEALTSDGATALIVAATQGHADTVDFLLKNGSNINCRKNGQSALNLAILKGQSMVVSMLLQHDNIDIHVKNTEGQTPLHLSASFGQGDIVNSLLRKGAKIDEQDKRDWTPLRYAVDGLHYGVVEILVTSGANLKIVSLSGKSPLTQACSKGDDGANIVEYLLRNGALVQGQLDVTSPLHAAVISDSVKVIEMILERGSDLNAKNENGSTPLHLSVEQSSLKFTRLLLEKGTNVDSVNKQGDTPMHLAVKNGSKDIVNKLLQYRASTSSKNRNGQTPISIAKLQAFDTQNNEILELLTQDSSMDEVDGPDEVGYGPGDLRLSLTDPGPTSELPADHFQNITSTPGSVPDSINEPVTLNLSEGESSSDVYALTLDDSDRSDTSYDSCGSTPIPTSHPSPRPVNQKNLDLSIDQVTRIRLEKMCALISQVPTEDWKAVALDLLYQLGRFDEDTCHDIVEDVQRQNYQLEGFLMFFWFQHCQLINDREKCIILRTVFEKRKLEDCLTYVQKMEDDVVQKEKNNIKKLPDKTLMRLAGELGNTWWRVGINLGFTRGELEHLLAGNATDRQKATFNMLCKWRDGYNVAGPIDTFLGKALKEAECLSLAEEFKLL